MRAGSFWVLTEILPRPLLLTTGHGHPGPQERSNQTPPKRGPSEVRAFASVRLEDLSGSQLGLLRPPPLNMMRTAGEQRPERGDVMGSSHPCLRASSTEPPSGHTQEPRLHAHVHTAVQVGRTPVSAQFKKPKERALTLPYRLNSHPLIR